MKALLLTLFSVSLLFSQMRPVAADEAKRPDRWLKDMAAFDKRDAGTAPPKEALLFVGSSTIRLWDLKTSWPDDATINNGFGGSTLADSITHFKRLIPPYDARAVIVYAGDNDIKTGRSAGEVITDVKALYALIATAKPGLPVIFIGIKPSISRWSLWPEMKKVNEAVAALEGSLADFHYADVAAIMLPPGGGAPGAEWFKQDGLHLSPDGYAKWTAVVKESMMKADVRR
jgi:lysophospholipase L1-like esterase